MSIYLEKKEKCCGCKACQDICSFNAISFNCDDEGFWYPNIDENKCVECKLCEKICPQLIKIEEKNHWKFMQHVILMNKLLIKARQEEYLLH